jgi:hypothetical protein
MLGIDYLWGAKVKPLQISDSVVFILTSLAHHSVKFRRHLSTGGAYIQSEAHQHVAAQARVAQLALIGAVGGLVGDGSTHFHEPGKNSGPVGLQRGANPASTSSLRAARSSYRLRRRSASRTDCPISSTQDP